MPRYEYFCPNNGQSLIVRHCRSESIRTWGELCQAASAEVGSTPSDAVVEQRSQLPCTCASGCACCDGQHDRKHKHSHHHGHPSVPSRDTAMERQ